MAINLGSLGRKKERRNLPGQLKNEIARREEVEARKVLKEEPKNSRPPKNESIPKSGFHPKKESLLKSGLLLRRDRRNVSVEQKSGPLKNVQNEAAESDQKKSRLKLVRRLLKRRSPKRRRPKRRSPKKRSPKKRSPKREKKRRRKMRK